MKQDQLRGWVGQLPQDEVFRELLIAQVESHKQLNKIAINTLVIGGLMVFGGVLSLIGVLMSL